MTAEDLVDDAPLPPPAIYDTGRFGKVRIVARHCPLCEAGEGEPIAGYGAQIWRLVRCRGCGFVYLDHAPEYDALVDDMAWEKTGAAELERRAATRPISYRLSRATRLRMRLLPRKRMAELVARHARPGNVVDLGCGTGGQLAGLAPVFVPFGIEISAVAAAEADRIFRARGGAAVNRPALDGLRSFSEGFFSAATLRSYLEHELHPRAVLAELGRVLAPDGVAIVKVPNYASLNRRIAGPKWCGYRYPDHLNYFTPASLSAMAAKCGFSARFGPTGRLPTSDNMYALLTKR